MRKTAQGGWPFADAAFAEYLRCFGPETIHASCEDYRAASTIDLEHDRADRQAGRKIECPVLALWGERGAVHRFFRPLEAWRAAARGSVEGRSLPCAHYLAEEQPVEVAAELERFLA